MQKREFIEQLTRLTGDLVEQIDKLPETAHVSGIHIRDASGFETPPHESTPRKVFRNRLSAYATVKMTLTANTVDETEQEKYPVAVHPGNGFGQD